jgi:hypothetical protein
MVCLDPNLITKPAQSTDLGINPAGLASADTGFPPQMIDLVNAIQNGTAFVEPTNITVFNQIMDHMDTLPPSGSRSGGTSDDSDIMNNMYNWTGDVRFDPYTNIYEVSLPPLLPDTGGIDDVLNTVGNHIIGIEDTIHGLPGSLGLNNIFRTMGYANAGLAVRDQLGLPDIPDCGLLNGMVGTLLDKLQPLFNLLSKLLGPIIGLAEDILGIMSAILKELKELLAIAQQLKNFANASQLLRLDPCSIILTGTLGQTNFIDLLNDARGIVDPLGDKIISAGSAIGF